MKNQLEILNEICNKAGWKKPYSEEEVEQFEPDCTVHVSFEEAEDDEDGHDEDLVFNKEKAND